MIRCLQVGACPPGMGKCPDQVARNRWMHRMGGRLPERLVQGREAGDHAVHADEGEHAEDCGGGDH